MPHPFGIAAPQGRAGEVHVAEGFGAQRLREPVEIAAVLAGGVDVELHQAVVRVARSVGGDMGQEQITAMDKKVGVARAEPHRLHRPDGMGDLGVPAEVQRALGLIGEHIKVEPGAAGKGVQQRLRFRVRHVGPDHDSDPPKAVHIPQS